MVVTATRSAQSLADAPAAVTVVDEKTIESKNVSRLGDALDQVPSLYLQNGAFGPSQGTSGTSGMSLRGIDQNKTLILLDGQPIQDASSGKVNWRIPFTEDIERIEVVPARSRRSTAAMPSRRHQHHHQAAGQTPVQRQS